MSVITQGVEAGRLEVESHAQLQIVSEASTGYTSICFRKNKQTNKDDHGPQRNPFIAK